MSTLSKSVLAGMLMTVSLVPPLPAQTATQSASPAAEQTGPQIAPRTPADARSQWAGDCEDDGDDDDDRGFWFFGGDHDRDHDRENGRENGRDHARARGDHGRGHHDDDNCTDQAATAGDVAPPANGLFNGAGPNARVN